MVGISSALADSRRGHEEGAFSRPEDSMESIMEELQVAALRLLRPGSLTKQGWFHGFASLRHQTVVPAPAVSWRAASPLTTAISTQPELPTSAINVPECRSP